MRSAVKVDAEPYRGGVKASVYIDYRSMNNYVNATGFQVATFANEGTHGGLSVNHKPHVWDDTVDNTVNNGTLLEMALKKEFIDRMAETGGITKKDARRGVELFFETLMECMSEGEKVMFSGLGRFEMKERIDDMGKLSVNELLDESPEWCPLRKH